VFVTAVIVAVPLLLGLILSYDVIKPNWRSTMEVQPAFKAQEGPRESTGSESIRFDGPSIPKDGEQVQNPVPADAVSLERGQQLFKRNCVPCHGEGGLGDGPITRFWKADMKKPANLTEQRIRTASDSTIYLTISQGFGAMPPLGENVNVRERWDIVNYVKTLGK